MGSVVASRLVRSTPDRAVWVRVLAGDIVLCSWARHLILTVPLFTQLYRRVASEGASGRTGNSWTGDKLRPGRGR